MGQKVEISEIEEGLIKTTMEYDKEKMTIWSVYNLGNIHKFYEHWSKGDIMEESKVIVGGDFNIRIGNRGSLVGRCEVNEREMENRESKDKTCSNGCNKLIEFCEERVWSIVNGNFSGDEEGEFTFTYLGATGSSVIDLVIVNDNVS